MPLLSWADGGGKPAVYEHAFLENEKLSGSFISSENEELDIVESVELLAGHRRELYLFPVCRILYNSCPINVSGPHDEGGDEKFSQNAPEND